jgi:hypothetical protein
MIAYYLLKYGDHTTTHPTAVHHVDSFNRVRVVGLDPLNTTDIYELGNGKGEDEMEEVEDKVEGMEGATENLPSSGHATKASPLKAMNMSSYYSNRHSALSMFSPVEVIMMFRGGKGGRKLPLDPEHDLSGSHGHTALTRFHLPRIIGHIPFRPKLVRGPSQDEKGRLEYAAFAISNFYTDRPGEDEELQGADAWEQLPPSHPLPPHPLPLLPPLPHPLIPLPPLPHPLLPSLPGGPTVRRKMCNLIGDCWINWLGALWIICSCVWMLDY